MQDIRASLLFYTGNSEKTQVQLSQEFFSRQAEKLQLMEEYSALEATNGERCIVDNFDKDNLQWKMILRGLLMVDDATLLSPDKRLLLAQWRYLEEELDCLIELSSKSHKSDTNLSYHKSSEFVKAMAEIGQHLSTPIKKADPPLTSAMPDESREDGELSDLEDKVDDSTQPNNSTLSGDSLSSVDTRCIADRVASRSEFSTKAMTPKQPLESIQSAEPLSKESEAWKYFQNLHRMTEEDRDKELRQVQIRYQKKYYNQKLKSIMPVFDPTADVGILITYGMLIPPKAMKIRPNYMKLIEAGRRFRGMSAELPNRSNNLTKNLVLPIPTHRSPVVSAAEVAAVKRRYVLEHEGDKMVDVMPVFDPCTDLGKLILWGEYIPPQSMQISALHLAQIRETRAARGLDPTLPNHSRLVSVNISSTASDKLLSAGSDFASQLGRYQSTNQYTNTINDIECTVVQLQSPGNSAAAVVEQRARLERLLQRVRVLEEGIPVEQRVQIPELWVALSKETSTAGIQSPIVTGKRKNERGDGNQVDSNQSPSPSKRRAPPHEVPTNALFGEVSEASLLDAHVVIDPISLKADHFVKACETANSTVGSDTPHSPKNNHECVMEVEKHAVEDFRLSSCDAVPSDDNIAISAGVASAVHGTDDAMGGKSRESSGLGEREKVQRDLERMQELYNLWISD